MARMRLKLGFAGGVALVFAVLFPATALAPSDLSLTKSDSPDPVTEGNQLTFVIEVRNDGPDPAANVVVTDDLSSSDFDLVSTTPSQGNCTTQGGQKVSCALGTLETGATAMVTIVVTAKKAGTVTNTASVTSDVDDPQPANNTATSTTTVQEAPGGGKPPKGATCKTAVPTIIGTEGNDTLVGTEGSDVIFGLGGDDTITGLGGNDLICAGPGNDVVKGQAGADFLRGGGGNDVLKGGA